MKTLRLIFILISFAAIAFIGLVAALIADAACWVDDRCHHWCAEIWKGVP